VNNQQKIKAAEKRKKELQLLIDCWKKEEQATKEDEITQLPKVP